MLFDRRTWQTHILNPAAAELLDRLLAEPGALPAPRERAGELLLAGLQHPPDSDDGRQLLDMFARLGIIAG